MRLSESSASREAERGCGSGVARYRLQSAQAHSSARKTGATAHIFTQGMRGEGRTSHPEGSRPSAHVDFSMRTPQPALGEGVGNAHFTRVQQGSLEC